MANFIYNNELMQSEILNDTLTCISPSGGYHYIYKLSKNKVKKLEIPHSVVN